MFNMPVPGLATQTIECFYEAKLMICGAWDAVLGLNEIHPCSAVKLLNECYPIRRLQCRLVDRCFGL
jgi:hypothetical protein